MPECDSWLAPLAHCTSRLRKTPPTDTYTKPQDLSGASEEMRSEFGLIYRYTKWCKPAVTVQWKTLTDSFVPTTDTHSPLVRFLQPLREAGLMGYETSWKSVVTTEMHSYKHQGLQLFPSKLEVRPEETKQGFQGSDPARSRWYIFYARPHAPVGHLLSL